MLPRTINPRVKTKDAEKEKEAQRVTVDLKENHHPAKHLLAEARAKTTATNAKSVMAKMVENH